MNKPQFPTTLTGYAIHLVAVDKNNQALLFNWRNEINIRQQMINQNPISLEEHLGWFDSLKNQTFQQHFVIYYKDAAIGAINIKALNNNTLLECQQGEVGLYIANDCYKGNIITFAPSLVINDYAFKQLKLNQLRSKVRADNHAALKYNQQLGYKLEPEINGFIEISLTADNYDNATQSLKNLLTRGKKVVDRNT